MTVIEVNPYETQAIAPLLDLVECVCTELTAAGGEPCWCGLLPGATVSWDYCTDCGNDHCGMAWVRVVGITPYDVFPTGIIDLRCARPLALQIEVGSLRCMPQPADGELLTPEASVEVSLRQVLDALALHRALQCCQERDFALSAYTPVGPQGGCVGGFWTAFIDISLP